MEPMTPTRRDPSSSLDGCMRIMIIGRTGSGKTTLARDIAAVLQVPHVELDSLYFGPNFSTVPESVLRERVATAIEEDRWVTDGNKRAVRDLVWPRAGHHHLAGLSGRGESVAAAAEGIASYGKLANASCSGGPYKGPTQAADRRGEGGAHCDSVPHWTAKRVPPVVRSTGEPAPRGGSSPLTASDTTLVPPSPLTDVDICSSVEATMSVTSTVTVPTPSTSRE